MSGRPYARNPHATACSGPRDLEAILPHSFRIEAPMHRRDAKSKAIRSAIRRRCKQKNWRKIISLRQQKCADTVKDQSDLSECKSEEKRQETVDVVATATRQLQELEQKLKDLTDQKHAKFQLLKEILVEEARSKTT
ncbi:hypothetical protein CCR75_004462 [Bremia lactucae]|uniref:Uncharacterized protein n=1 Tax=Bremia lactucae TaxID=4779 RepID=A0A976NY21_BRELC|nr:hypothetical protein CCR75_004462 [Bremia lactucae]